MIRYLGCFLLLAVLLAMPLRSEANDPETMGILKERAENFVKCMLAGSVNSIAGEMSPNLRRTYTNEVVRNIFGDLHQRGGVFEEMGEATLSVTRTQSVVAMVPIRYSKQSVTARLIFERAGRHSPIYQFAILPYTELNPDSVWRDPNAPVTVRPLASPSYTNALLFRREKVTLDRGVRSALSGSLLMPTIATASAPVPLVVLVTQPSATGQPPMVGASNPARDLSEGLATKGVAVLILIPDELPPEDEEEEAKETPKGEEAKSEEEASKAEIENPLLASIAGLVLGRAELDNEKVYFLQSGEPMDGNPLESDALLGASSAHLFSYWMFDVERIATAEEIATGDPAFRKGRREVVFSAQVEGDSEGNSQLEDLAEGGRSYKDTGPLLVEIIQGENSTTHGHIPSEMVDDVAYYALKGRLPTPTLQ
jgi:hypothetical protein